MNQTKLKRLYGRLNSIKNTITSNPSSSLNMVDDYNKVVGEISSETKEDFNNYQIGSSDIFTETYDDLATGLTTHSYVKSGIFEGKISQLISELEYGFNINESTVEIGSLYNAIDDDELKARCSDLLSAKANFDRAVNQATQILEDRLRTKSGVKGSLVGVALVNKVLNSEISKTVLIVSDDPKEHEGYCHIFRGVVSALRNPSHHSINNDMVREEALKICGFIDVLLKVIDHSKKKK